MEIQHKITDKYIHISTTSLDADSYKIMQGVYGACHFKDQVVLVNLL